MKTAKHEVLFQPDGLRIAVEPGTLLTDAMKRIGITVQLPCAGTGKCGKCIVEIQPEAPDPTPFDTMHLGSFELERGLRLACQTRVDRDMSVLVPEGMRVLDGRILVDGTEQVFDLSPVIKKTYVELPEPSLKDQAADLFRVKRAMGYDADMCPEFDIDLVRELPSRLRKSDFKVTVVTVDGRVVAVEEGDTTGRSYGIAFDIGTTTVVGTIMDLNTGTEIARASRLNAQVVFGEDTISRIQHAITDPDGLNELRRKIRGVINEIIREAVTLAGIAEHELYEAVFSGNTTMSHLLLGLDPGGLSQIPFVPVVTAGVNLRAEDAGISINPRGNIHVLPNIAGFVGSDTVGVMLACGYLDDGPSTLAVDVGTNGELALRRDGDMMVCSTAAGPALEGAALTCGMRAAKGAVEHVRFTGEAVEVDVIGDAEPVGICGSGIIDVLAELLNAGLVDEYGTMLSRETAGESVPEFLCERLVAIDDQPAFVLSRSKTPANTRDVVLTQRDVRQIQLAKGAISAGITLLLAQMDMIADDLDEVLLAGAFGNYIRKESALRIGLLPRVPEERIRFVGNAASTGAKMALLSANARCDADLIRAKTSHIELANLPEFMNELSNSMLFSGD